MRQIIPALLILIVMASCSNQLRTQSNTNDVYTFADASVSPERGTDANYVYPSLPDSMRNNASMSKDGNTSPWHDPNVFSYSSGNSFIGGYHFDGYGCNTWQQPFGGWNHFGNYNGFGYRDPFCIYYVQPYATYNMFGNFTGFGSGMTGNFNWFNYYGGHHALKVNAGISRVRGNVLNVPGTAGNPGSHGASPQAAQGSPGLSGHSVTLPQPVYQAFSPATNSTSNGAASPTGLMGSKDFQASPNQPVPVTAPVYQTAPVNAPDANPVPTFSNSISEWGQPSGGTLPNIGHNNSGRVLSNPLPAGPSGWQTTPAPASPQRNMSEPAPAPAYSSPNRTYSSPSPTVGGGGAPSRMSRPR